MRGRPNHIFKSGPLVLLAALLAVIIIGPAPVRTAQAAEDGARPKIVVFAPLTAHFAPDGQYREMFKDDLEDRWSGRVELRAFPDEFQNQHNHLKVRRTLEDLADEPDLAAVVIGEAPAGCLDGIARLRTRRPDLYVFVLDPYESLEGVGKTASLTISLNQQARGVLYPTMAGRMGAENLVYLSFPRHQDITFLSRQHRVMSAVAEDQGLALTSSFNGPDPLAASRADLEDYLAQAVERHLELSGPRTAFMTTSTVYSEILAPIIAQKGGALLEPIQPSLLLGLPEALNLSEEGRNLFGYWRRLLTALDEKFLENPPAGQFTAWTYPYPHTAMLAMVELAVAAIDEQADIYDLKNVAAALEKYSQGVKWQVTFHMDYVSDNVIPQVILLLQDTYWLGHGYQGFTRLNIPSRYYHIR